MDNGTSCCTFLRYDGRTSIFTVPVGKGGLYYFYTHLSTPSHQYAMFHLKKNNYTVSVMEGDNSNNSRDHDTITTAITVRLNQDKFRNYKNIFKI